MLGILAPNGDASKVISAFDASMCTAEQDSLFSTYHQNVEILNDSRVHFHKTQTRKMIEFRSIGRRYQIGLDTTRTATCCATWCTGRSLQDHEHGSHPCRMGVVQNMQVREFVRGDIIELESSRMRSSRQLLCDSGPCCAFPGHRVLCIVRWPAQVTLQPDFIRKSYTKQCQ